VTAGWTHYRAGRIPEAGAAFAAALERCPGDQAARIGAAYVALRRDSLAVAGARFAEAVRRDSLSVDALFGMGLVALRRDAPDPARRWFARVVARDSAHAEAKSWLGRLGRAPRRPPLRLPPATVVQARARGDRFEVPAPGGWRPFYVKGINLGAALPGRFPSEFPDSATYAAWIADIAAMGANTIRVYTIHPPWFYQALLAHNAAHPAQALWLIHGVWTELPPRHDFEDLSWHGAFLAEARRVVDLVHGRADIAARAGHASGFYTADVSRWTLAYLIGREWEPFAVAAFDAAHPGRHGWGGRYLRTEGSTATERWLTRVCDALVAYETATYRHQRPVAYTSWPTLDPLTHVSEAPVADERRMRRRAGERRPPRIREYDNDRVALDPSRLTATPAFAAGVFAAYHAYPYYPDFMVLGAGYGDWLARIRAHHAGMPVLIAEYGVPASIGVAHLAPNGWHHGGHTEARMAEVDTTLTRLLAHSGMAGGVLFAWMDEWFKRNWLVVDLEIPLDHKPRWLSRMNAEEQYGVIAMEPAPRIPGGRLADRLPGWRALPALYPDRLRALADEAYLQLLVEAGPDADSVLVGLDIRDPRTGSFRWPGRGGAMLPFGIEFLVAAAADTARVLADPSANPFVVRPGGRVRLSERVPPVDRSVPGFFTGPYDLGAYRLPLGGRRRNDGRFDPLRVVTNRRRVGRDGTLWSAAGYERGVLPRGPLPDGLWERDSASGAVELRIPWNLVNVSDPSARLVLGSLGRPPEFAPEAVESIGLVLAVRTRSGGWRRWPAAGADGARFSWPTWEEPRWRARRRPVYEAMRAVFRTVDYRRGSP
jgi:hypothetical protein